MQKRSYIVMVGLQTQFGFQTQHLVDLSDELFGNSFKPTLIILIFRIIFHEKHILKQ